LTGEGHERESTPSPQAKVWLASRVEKPAWPERLLGLTTTRQFRIPRSYSRFAVP